MKIELQNIPDNNELALWLSQFFERQEVIDKCDSKLKELRSVWGEEVYKAVADALLELNDYNSSGRYVVPKLWNFNKGRKASLKEVINNMIEELKTLKVS